ncbi:MAG: hypothetical protein ACT4NL_11105 [Pseudomarimonas sp.]
MFALRHIALAAGLLLFAAGLVLHPPWSPLLTPHLTFTGKVAAASAAAAWMLAQALRTRFAVGMALVALLLPMSFHGVGVIVGASGLLLASLGLGSLLMPAPRRVQAYGRAVEQEESSDAPWLAFPLGIGLLAGAAGWLLPMPIFSQPVITGLLILIVLLMRDRIRDQLHSARHTLMAAVDAQPLAAGALALVLLIAGLPAALPVMWSDDLATHLQIGWQLQELGYYRMDVGSQVWSTAPWLGDVAYGLLQLLAAAEGVGVLNLLMLALTAWLLLRISQVIGLDGPLPWLVAMLYVSIPLVGGLTMSMQTETASAAVTAALALWVLTAPAKPEARTLLVAAGLTGVLLGLKILNGAFVAPLAALLLWRWGFSVPWRELPRAVLLGAFIAGSSYFYAYALTGNPVLPLFNGFFESPWFQPSSIVDSRWQTGMGPLLPYWLTFRTSDYFESGGLSGGGGFALLAFLFGGIGAISDTRARPLLLAGLAAWLIPLSQVQYLRYTLPALVLLLPALVAGVVAPGRRRSLLVAGAAIIVLQLAFQPSASWLLSKQSLSTLMQDGEESLLNEMTAERLLARELRHVGKVDDRVLITGMDHPAHAELAGRGFVASWYDPELGQAVTSARSEAEGWAAAVARSGATLLWVRAHAASDGLREYLRTSQARLEKRSGAVEQYRLPWPRHPGAVIAANPDKIALRFDPRDSGDRLLAAHVELGCSQPHAPIAVAWQAERNPGNLAWVQHNWVFCSPSGVATIDMVLALPADWSRLHFEAAAVDGYGPQTLELRTQGVIERPDLARARDLSRVVRRTVCRRWKMCRELERPQLLEGPG